MTNFSTLNFDVLHNFISPVTGRILADYNYILIGNRDGIATPSPILLDIQLELIALRKRFNMLVLTDFVTGHQNDELRYAQVLSSMPDGLVYSTAGVVSTLPTIPLSSLPDLTEDYLWTGDSSNRPIEVQRIKLKNLPDFLTINPLANFGVKNLYTGSVFGASPTTTLQIDMSNLPNLPVGYLWIGQSVPLVPSSYPIPPVDLNWGPTRPVAVSTILSSNLPGLTYKRIWRGDITGRPVESDDLTIAEADILALESEIAVIEGEIAAMQADIVLINADLAVINATLYTPVVGLVTVVAGLVVTTAALSASVAILLARTLDQVPLAVADVDLNNNRIINLSDPVDPLDAVNYQTLVAYVGAGAVTSISGTANRITASAPTGAVTLDIAATYVGQTSITTLGTIGTGTWNGSIIGLPYGGTNANLTASNGGIVYSTATAMAILAGTATANQVLLSGSSSAPSWSTATYPATTTINQILYSSAANTVTGIATANNAVLLTNGSGVPAWQTLTSSAVTSISGTANRITASASTGAVTLDIAATYVGQTSITTLGTISTGTWNGTDIGLSDGGTNASLTASNGGVVYSTASAMAILAGTATANRVLLSGSSAAPAWSTATYPATITGGRLLYASSSNVITGLVSTNNAVLLTDGSGVPAWQTLTSSAVTSITGTANQITASASTGAVTLSMPSAVVVTTSVTAGNLKISADQVESTSTNLSIIPSGSNHVYINPSPSGSSKIGMGTSSPLHFVDIYGDVRLRRIIADNNISTTVPSRSLGPASVVGTGATSSITGGELAGTFTLNSGTSITLTGTICTFTLVSAMPNSTFSVIFFPVDPLTSLINTYAQSGSTTTFTFGTTTTLTASTLYRWNYLIVGCKP